MPSRKATESSRLKYHEEDLVSHSGPSARGEFGYSVNLTDVYLGWCQTRAVLSRGEEGVVRTTGREIA